MALNTTSFSFLGRPSASIVNSPNCWAATPSATVSAFQSTLLTMSVSVPSSVTIGVANFVVVTCTVQPGFASTVTVAIGVCGGVGNATCSSVILAGGSSLGARNDSVPVEPFGAELGSTVTCAHAGAANVPTV